MSFSKKYIFFGLLCLILSSFYFPNLAFSQELYKTDNQARFVETAEEAKIYNKDQKIVGEFKPAIQLSIETIQDGKIYFQWDGDLAYIEEKDAKLIVDSESTTFTMVKVGTGGNGGKILTHTNTVIYSDNSFKIPFFILAPEVEYAVTKNNGEYYSITIGNRVGIIKAADVKLINHSDGNEQKNTLQGKEIDLHEPAILNKPAVTSIDIEKESSGSDRVESSVAEFSSTDRYFEVAEETLAIFDNSTGSLTEVGHLNKGQVYPRVSDYGNWHQIKFGNGFGYVWKGSTIPTSSNSLKNLNKGLANTNRYFIPNEQLSIYDNTSGSLVPFASLKEQIQYPIISDNGNWYEIDVTGRIGYVYKPATTRTFVASDRFFKVTDESVAIFNNSTGSLIQVGYLNKGQVYPRVSDYGGWHQIKFGNGFGYVYKGSTTPTDSRNINNLNTGLYIRNQYFIPNEQLSVYDNTSGSLVPFASLKAQIQYPIISDNGNWYQIDVAGRIGYVYKPATTRSFLASDRFFKVTEESVAIYDNSTGSLILVGYLNKGQVYPRISDYGGWHQIKFGNGFGYVYKESTIPDDSRNIKNLNTGLYNRNQYFIPNEQLSVYDNTSGSLVPFASLNVKIQYPIIRDIGNWYQIDVAGRIGYVYKGFVSGQSIEGKVIVLDAGHGGSDPGAIGKYN